MEGLTRFKQAILRAAKKAYREKLMAGTSGNMSVFFPERKWMIITPSSYDYEIMEEKDIVVTDLEGNVIEGCHRPSSEWRMHAEITVICPMWVRWFTLILPMPPVLR